LHSGDWRGPSPPSFATPRPRRCPSSRAPWYLRGTIFYWRFEDWTIIQALYFSVVTLTTVGFGDFTPTTAGTQIFTIIYILTGLGLLVALLSSVAQQYLRQKAERDPVRDRLRARRQRHRSD
jgi:voltage-gated potassium channel Kch